MPSRKLILRPTQAGSFSNARTSILKIEITGDFEGEADQVLADIEDFFRDYVDQPFLRGEGLGLVRDQGLDIDPADLEAAVTGVVKTIIGELYGPDERFAARSRARITNALMVAASQGYRLGRDET